MRSMDQGFFVLMKVLKKITYVRTSLLCFADCRLLWEFIHQLLLDTKYSKYVCWENKEDYVFRIANPTGTVLYYFLSCF